MARIAAGLCVLCGGVVMRLAAQPSKAVSLGARVLCGMHQFDRGVLGS